MKRSGALNITMFSLLITLCGFVTKFYAKNVRSEHWPDTHVTYHIAFMYLRAYSMFPRLHELMQINLSSQDVSKIVKAKLKCTHLIKVNCVKLVNPKKHVIFVS